MGKLEERVEKLEYKLSCEVNHNFIEHKHCERCGKVIYGKLSGEDETDLERRNPFFRHQLCLDCVKRLALNTLKK